MNTEKRNGISKAFQYSKQRYGPDCGRKCTAKDAVFKLSISTRIVNKQYVNDKCRVNQKN